MSLRGNRDVAQAGKWREERRRLREPRGGPEAASPAPNYGLGELVNGWRAELLPTRRVLSP